MIHKNNNEPTHIHVEHSEVVGLFVLKKPTIGAKMEVERVKGAMMGPFPTPDGEQIAELSALVQCGYEKVPEGFDVKAITSEKLLEGLYKEVVLFWDSFRAKDQA